MKLTLSPLLQMRPRDDDSPIEDACGLLFGNNTTADQGVSGNPPGLDPALFAVDNGRTRVLTMPSYMSADNYRELASALNTCSMHACT